MRKTLLLTAATAAVLFAGWQIMPSALAALGDGARHRLCSFMSDQCLDWRRNALEATRAELSTDRARVQEATRTEEAHAAQLRQALDAIRANSQLLAQREAERRARNGATLDFAGRSYTPSDVEAQARLWAAEQTQFETILNTDIASRRAKFAEARERVSLAYSKVDSVIQTITADLAIAPVLRDLDTIRRLSTAADEATHEASELLDPVRSVLELPPVPAPVAAPRSGDQNGFNMDDWLRQNGATRP